MARERHAPRKLTGRAVETITPATIRRPFANYSHGIVVPAGSRLLFASGQLGITAEDHIPEDAGAQAELCFRALRKS
jgi:enamine deaminase RidA (YjgF/YER057c/UK114 family)